MTFRVRFYKIKNIRETLRERDEYSMKNNHEQVKRYCGRLEQVFGIKELIRSDGRAAGTKELHVSTGGGLEFVLNASRCLDITSLRFAGRNIGFLAKPGVNTVPGAFHESAPLGMLTTCGLGTCGKGSDSQPFHGKIGLAPAENLCLQADENIICVSGNMHESVLFAENFLFKRKISCVPFENKLVIEDVIENNTENEMPYYLLYHVNFGYPFLDEALTLQLPQHNVRPRDKAATAGLVDYTVMKKPVDNYAEQVFFFEQVAQENGEVVIGLQNKALGIGARLCYDPTLLPNLAMWKSLKSGDYALGLEPANNTIQGHLRETSSFSVPPYGQVSIKLSLEFFVL